MKRILFKNSDHHATLPTDVDLIQKPSGVDSREAAILFLSAAIGREYYSGLDAKNRLK